VHIYQLHRSLWGLLRAGQARTHRVLRDQCSPVWLKALDDLPGFTKPAAQIAWIEDFFSHRSGCFRSNPEVVGSHFLPLKIQI
jgi:hypothetical protein